MAALSTIAWGIAGAGLAVQGASAIGQYKDRKEVTKASQRAERLREQQMQLENMRKQRELIRQQQNARALAAARSVAQGAGQGENASTSLFGAYGQVRSPILRIGLPSLLFP